jgi:hypothetical protein
LDIDFSKSENFVSFTTGGVSAAGIVRDVHQVVPEPPSLLLLGLALAGVSAQRWRQRRQQ